jgi:hypothetical protein
MRNENSSRWTGRANLLGNTAPPQEQVAPTLKKKTQNLWKAPVTAEYLRALREADELVFQAILRGTVLRHTARLVKA